MQCMASVICGFMMVGDVTCVDVESADFSCDFSSG